MDTPRARSLRSRWSRLTSDCGRSASTWPRKTRICAQTRVIRAGNCAFVHKRGDKPPRSAARRALDLSLGIALRDRLALVVLALAARQPDLDLRAIAREVNAQRNERVALLPHLADEARDLLVMEQQLARAQWLVVHQVALRVWRDVHVLQPGLIAVDAHV